MSAGHRRSKADIERELQDLARTLNAPAPDYSDRVLRALAAHSQEPAPVTHRPPGAGLSPRARRILIAAVVVVIAVAVTITVPGSRRALASWFGFAGIEIRHAPIRTSPPPAAGLPVPLHAGAKVTLAEARAAMAGQLQLPAALPAPTAVYLRRDRAAVVVTLAYATAPRLRPTADTGYALILTEIANAGHPLFEKILGMNTSAVVVTVARDPGVFINGPQEIITVDPSRPSQGQPTVHEVAARSSANTIIWRHGSITYRLEGDFSRRAAVALASTIP
jgi:hypothetical protein